MRDFFISYTHDDQAWAEWIAWQLEAEQYTTVLQAWDFRPGENFVVRMRDALQEADRTIAVLSNAYLASPYATDEWTAAFLHDPHGRQRLLPVRVEVCELPWLLATLIYIDLVGVDETTARRRLQEGVTRARGTPKAEPGYPGGRSAQAEGRTEPRFPGEWLKISNLPPRNPTFTGRDELLDKLHRMLSVGQTTAVVAAHGLGGVGKTQLALEYAHHYGEQYWLRWLVSAEDPLRIRSSLSELASRLGLSLEPEQERMVAAVREYLDGAKGWLMVFDDATEPADLLPLLPSSGQGHVIITTRNPNWEELAGQLEVDVLSEEDAWAFLAQRTGNTDQPEVAQLAEELGYLPLALAQAAAYIQHTPELTVAGYLALYRREHQRLLKAGKLVRYQETVATTWLLNFERLIRTAPAAIQLLNLCAFLGSEVVPLSLNPPSRNS
jgi:hypothetical protein